MKLKKQKTQRGFSYIEFEDLNGEKCSVQKSSIATEDAIWLGCTDINLKKLTLSSGWEDIDTTDCIANNRMHLTRKQAKKLLPILKKFVKTGEL